MTVKKSSFSRGALAKQTGVNIETIRYYEKDNVMPDPPRSSGGHRLYDSTHLKRLYFIRRCRELGFSLDEIRGLLNLVNSQHYTCAEVKERTTNQLENTRQKIRDLRKMERTLKEMVAECSGGMVPDCPIVDTLFA